MRNDFIGASIDGDARAACGCHGNGANTINTAGCGCDNNRQARCGCGNTRQSRQNSNSCGCDDCEKDYSRQNNKPCGCDYDNRQSRKGGCDDCEKDYSRQNNKPCGCDYDNRQSRKNRCDDCDYSCGGRAPAMVYAEHHDLDSMYCAEKALIRGTLFGCLDKPMCNEQCSGDACATKCQEDKFAIWELRLYLNTHPCDQKALALLRKLTEQMDEDCACAYTSDCNRWSWLDGPWPWEYQRCCGKEA